MGACNEVYCCGDQPNRDEIDIERIKFTSEPSPHRNLQSLSTAEDHNDYLMAIVQI